MTIIVSVSGGKDSTAMLVLATKTISKSEIRAVYQDTGFEHPSVYQYLDYLEDKLQIKIERLKSKQYRDVPDFCEKTGTLPNFRNRGCTGELKQFPFRQYLIEQNLCQETTECWFGIRAQESNRRSEKYGGMSPEDTMPLAFLGSVYRLKALRTILARFPIVQWSEQEVFQYIADAGLEPNPLYASGFKRVGCFPCVLSGASTFRTAWRTPEGRRNILRLIDIEETVGKQNGRTFIKDKRLIDVVNLNDELPEDEPEIYCGFCHS